MEKVELDRETQRFTNKISVMLLDFLSEMEGRGVKPNDAGHIWFSTLSNSLGNGILAFGVENERAEILEIFRNSTLQAIKYKQDMLAKPSADTLQ